MVSETTAARYKVPEDIYNELIILLSGPSGGIGQIFKIILHSKFGFPLFKIYSSCIDIHGLLRR
jgi:hypothetical protein